MIKLKKLELMLMVAVAALLTIAVLGPAIAQPAHQHAFADQRAWHGIPFAMDVLSNLLFAVWGLAGLVCWLGLLVQAKERHTKTMHNKTSHIKQNTEHALAGLFFAGLVATAAASSYYHWQPDDIGLGFDRLGMAVAFAGLLGLAVASRISHRAGAAIAAAMLLLGPLSVWFWFVSSNVMPWLVVQFGGMALILWLAFNKPLHGALQVRWGAVIAVYAAAKFLELADHQIYELTSHAISGHSLKHLVASFAAWPVFKAVVSALGSAQKQGRIRGTTFENKLEHKAAA